MSTPYTRAKITAFSRALFALGFMLLGFVLAKGALAPIGVLIALFSCISAARHLGRFVRISAAEHVLRSGHFSEHASRRFREASLPHKIFLLLFTVAEVDGAADARERDIVRAFLLERFPHPTLAAEIRSWRAEPVPPDSLDELVHELRAQLSAPECETVFSWCAFVSLIDEKFSDSEHELLQRIAHHFGLPSHRARSLFLLAKYRVLGLKQQRGPHAGQGAGQGQGSWQRRGQGGAQRPTYSSSSRDRALEILGLEKGATKDQIRKRHRELVKKFHPDAHTHLGPVAAKEATERFREVQAAYEELGG